METTNLFGPNASPPTSSTYTAPPQPPQWRCPFASEAVEYQFILRMLTRTLQTRQTRTSAAPCLWCQSVCLWEGHAAFAPSVTRRTFSLGRRGAHGRARPTPWSRGGFRSKKTLSNDDRPVRR